MSDSFATPWTVAYQAPPFMRFSRQDWWNGLPFPSPGDLPDPGIKPGSPALQADALPSEPPGKPVWRIGIYSNLPYFHTMIFSSIHFNIWICTFYLIYRNDNFVDSHKIQERNWLDLLILCDFFGELGEGSQTSLEYQHLKRPELTLEQFRLC